MVPDGKSKQIVASLVNLSHAPGMIRLQRALETGFWHNLLGEMGAGYGQGIFYSRPVVAGNFVK